MAQKLADVKVVAGRLIPVVNTERKAFSNAKKQYLAVWVEDAEGGNERCILLTEKELARAEYRASKNPEDLTKKSWWTNVTD